MARPYQRLSQIYDEGWGYFAEAYFGLVKELFADRYCFDRRVLDVACGTGTLALRLARQGFSVLGVDKSPEMLAVAKAKVEPGLLLSFEIQDMKEFNVKGVFDLALCTFDSINYLLSEEEVARYLAKISHSLKLNGFFVFDSVTEALCRNKHHAGKLREFSEIRFLQELSYDPKKRIATTRFIFEDGEEEMHLQKPYGLKELVPLLHEAGFVICDKFSTLDGKPYRNGSERLVCITRKKGSLL